MKTGNVFYFYINTLNPAAALKLAFYKIIFAAHIFYLMQKINVRKLTGPISHAEECSGVLSVWRPRWFLVSGTLKPLAPLDFQQLPWHTRLKSLYSITKQPVQRP